MKREKKKQLNVMLHVRIIDWNEFLYTILKLLLSTVKSELLLLLNQLSVLIYFSGTLP